ncbi:signal recognition particle-docking protein FtsY [Xanthobacter autotrophicus DSM 431]|uniref:signal recognition particle-docking protein FtsY n=1 Tax=Xanthobacter nonsaccharivorans TaxID=3119912 RepID=UPI00372A5744
MSHEDPKAPHSSADAPKKKRGFWGWLTGGEETVAEGPGVEAPHPAPETPDGPELAEAVEPVADVPQEPETTVSPEAPEPVEAGPEEPAVAEEASAEVPAEPLVSEAEQPSPAPEAPAAAPDGPAPLAPAPAATSARKGFWSRLASGLARTASSLGQGITDLVSKRKLDAETLEELEDVLIRADLGVETSMRIVEAVGKGRHDKMISPEEVKSLIAEEVEAILAPVATPLVVDAAKTPFIVLMVGVNGSGKTTTIGKLAAQWVGEGRKVVLAAGDTFRAAAIEQLKVWGQRTGATVIAREQGADAAGVAHDAITTARAEGADILMIDTAGRLQNRAELMAELEKVVRVIKKLEPEAPHAVLLVLDATVGQNALSQVEAFARTAGVTGLVMTKLDGTARGGILVAIAAKHRLPIHLIGVGEGADDLQPFAARDFARAIAGLA